VIYEIVYRHFLFPLASKFKGKNINRYYKWIRKNEFQNREFLNNYSYVKLKNLLIHSYNTVPYYHEKWKKIGLNPTLDFNSLDDMKKIPPLTKYDIQNNLEKLISTKFNKKELIRNYTGGSTGKPLIFYQTPESKQWGSADILRHFSMCGWNLGDKYAFLWGADRDKPKDKIIEKIRKKVQRFKWYNSFMLSEQKLEEIYLDLLNYSPKLLIGYATSLYQLSLFLEKKNIKLAIHAVQSSAEKLYDFQRDKIKKYISNNIFDRYGCREVGNIAHECFDHSGLHVSEIINYVEILDKKGNNIEENKEGLITVTNLYNYGMPFIRYQNEDIGSFLSYEKCNCGRETKKLLPSVGRVSDNILTSTGKIIHGEMFTHLFYNYPQINQFQLSQENLYEIVIKILPNKKYPITSLNKILEEIKSKIYSWLSKDEINISFDIVEKIEKTETGKYRFTISKVWQDKIKRK